MELKILTESNVPKDGDSPMTTTVTINDPENVNSMEKDFLDKKFQQEPEGISYLELCAWKRERNKRILDSLFPPSNVPKIKRPWSKRVIKVGNKRRSPRLLRSERAASLRKRDSLHELPYDHKEDKVVDVKSNKVVKPKPTRTFPRVICTAEDIVQPTDEQKQMLRSKADLWTEFDTFLRTIDHGRRKNPCCKSNADMVLRQAKILFSGDGIEYHHWKKGVVFHKGSQIDLSWDFWDLHREAKEFEDRHGEDLGHGWLMKHPIYKLHLFQQYLLGGNYQH